MKKILITGAEGFIGSNLSQFFSSHGFEVIACSKKPLALIPNGVLNKEITLPSTEFDQVLIEAQPEYLIHCAGGSSVAESFKNPWLDFEKNVKVTDEVLASVSKNSSATKVVFISSAAVYGEPYQLPITEDSSTYPISPYGYHKLISEFLCQKYHQYNNLSIMVLRVFSVYGPGQRKQLLWDLCQKLISDNPVITLYGNGKETRDFIYITDLAKIIYKLLDIDFFNADVINVASGKATTVNQIAETLLKVSGADKKLHYLDKRKSGDPLYWSVETKLSGIIDMENFIPIDEGIFAYFRWFRSEVLI